MEALAAELGLAAPPAPWHTARDGVAELACLLGLLAGSLGKIATDVVLLAQSEVGEVAEPHEAGRGGSSTMPQKRNPISSEYILSACRGVHALVPLMLGAMLQDHERATGPWQSEMLALPQACTLAHGALARTRALLEGLQVDPARMRANIDITHGAIMAEAAMMGLAPLLGHEEAHHLVQHACDAALQDGIGPGGGVEPGPARGRRGGRAPDRSGRVSGRDGPADRPRAGRVPRIAGQDQAFAPPHPLNRGEGDGPSPSG